MNKMLDTFKFFPGLDALLLTSKANKFYFGGRYSDRGYVLLLKYQREPIYFVDYRSASDIGDEYQKIVLQKDDNPVDVVIKYIKTTNIKYFGLEVDHLSYNQFINFQEHLKSLQIESVDADILRYIKSDEEIETIRKACQIADESYLSFLKKIKIGMTENEAAMILVQEMKTRGARKESFETIVASGKHSASPHAKTSDKVIEYGDFVTVDFGARFQNYCSDTTRTFVMGEVLDERMRDIYHIVLKAFMNAAKTVQPGVSMEAIDTAARDTIIQAGYRQNFVHHLGHSLGIECHESPRLAQGDKSIIQKNMVFTNEPGVYIEGLGGVRIEDTFYVNETGLQSLNTTPKELMIVEA
ncbi:MAG: Xaa-Pro peptidase family protein [Atopostipes suicloacalis]|nr:Xaa-Pro peptidase family protein [Atopostipes suicloacalis]